MPVNAVIYTRRQQAANPQTVDEQIRACHQMAEREGLRVIGTYHDVGSANAPLVLRPGLRALLEDAKRLKFQAVLVADVDRLSRDNVMLSRLIRHLSFLNIRVGTTSRGECLWTMPALVRRIFDEFVRGVRPAEIAKRLNEEAVRR